jgi:hypothetical protein
MKRFWVPAFAAAAAIARVEAQQVDMQAVMLWSKAKVARFHVVGVYDKRTVIARRAGNYAQGDVTDGLTLDFDWNIHDNMVVGDVKLQNDTASLGQLASVEANCKPPRPKGAYEHFTASKVRSSDGARIEVDGTRHYPEVEVAGCEADQSYKLVAAADESLTEFVAVPSPMMLAVPGASAGGGNAAVAADRKSFTVKSNGWTWTYTPTPLP